MDLGSFSLLFSNVVVQIGREKLSQELIGILRNLVDFDTAVIVEYQLGDKPIIHHNDLPPKNIDSQIENFVKSAFVLDPFYRAALDRKISGIHRLSDLAPQGFRKTEYYRSYFKLTKIKDEIGYVFHLHKDKFINISLGRLASSCRFKVRELNTLDSITRIVESICIAQWGQKRTEKLAMPGNSLPMQLDTALKYFGTAFLTDRETQVVQLFLHGHSTKSIAEKLCISPETVKLHRKNSYAKLDVSSQAELFYLFIDSLSSLKNYSGGDPLVGYI
jgi:DNA-binding CsgD family transcriptional regulator